MARANSGDSKYLELWFEELIYFEKSVFFFRTILPLGDFFAKQDARTQALVIVTFWHSFCKVFMHLTLKW